MPRSRNGGEYTFETTTWGRTFDLTVYKIEEEYGNHEEVMVFELDRREAINLKHELAKWLELRDER